MKISTKFNKAILAGVLATTALAGCGQPGSDTEPKKTVEVIADSCVVVDLQTGNPYFMANAYDFRNGALIFNAGPKGYTYRDSVAMGMKGLQEDGQARALEMFSHLPASANCKAPKFNP